MIAGMGIDLASLPRFKKIGKRHPKVLDRLFTERERRYCRSKVSPWYHLAARFAAKEAFVKAAGRLLNPKEIEVKTGKGGKPFLTISGEALKMMKKKKVRRSHLSLSHDGDQAIAFVILEK